MKEKMPEKEVWNEKMEFLSREEAETIRLRKDKGNKGCQVYTFYSALLSV